MNRYLQRKWKTPGRAFGRFCGQIAGSLGVFFLVLTVFQSTSAGSLQWQQFLRESFTADADLAPVMQFFYPAPLDSPSVDGAVSVNAAAPVREAMAVPVTGTVLNEYGWAQDQLSSRFQEGLWIETAPGEAIRAAYSGTVTAMTTEDGVCTIEVSHANGLVTIYGCCAQSAVQLQEPVEKGQVLGKTQQRSTAGNFYFAARYLGEPVNPLELLQQDEIDTL